MPKAKTGDLAARITKLVEAGLSPELIADKTGCSVITLWRWRTGRAKPHRALLKAFEALEAETSKKR